MPKLEVSDLTRLKIGPGEILLVRLPRTMSEYACARASELIKANLVAAGMPCQVLLTRDDIEFAVIEGLQPTVEDDDW